MDKAQTLYVDFMPASPLLHHAEGLQKAGAKVAKVSFPEYAGGQEFWMKARCPEWVVDGIKADTDGVRKLERCGVLVTVSEEDLSFPQSQEIQSACSALFADLEKDALGSPQTLETPHDEAGGNVPGQAEHPAHAPLGAVAMSGDVGHVLEKATASLSPSSSPVHPTTLTKEQALDKASFLAATATAPEALRENIPDDIKALPCTLWVAMPKANKSGEWRTTKPPVREKNGTLVFSKGIETGDGLKSFDDVLSDFERFRGQSLQIEDVFCPLCGIGVVLQGNGLVGIDLDHCLGDGGDVLQWARPIVDLLTAAGTYIETSPSGDGLRSFLFGDIDKGCKTPQTFKDYGLEIYATGRYLTLTGRPFTGSSKTVGRGEKAGAAIKAIVDRIEDTRRMQKAGGEATPPLLPLDSGCTGRREEGPAGIQNAAPTKADLENFRQACIKAARVEGDSWGACYRRRIIYAEHGIPTRPVAAYIDKSGDFKCIPAKALDGGDGRALATIDKEIINADYMGDGEALRFKFTTALCSPRGFELTRSGARGIPCHVLDLDHHGQGSPNGVKAFRLYLEGRGIRLKDFLANCLWLRTKSGGVHAFLMMLPEVKKSIAFRGDLSGVELKAAGNCEILPNAYCQAKEKGEDGNWKVTAERSYILKGEGPVLSEGRFFDAVRAMVREHAPDAERVKVDGQGLYPDLFPGEEQRLDDAFWGPRLSKLPREKVDHCIKAHSFTSAQYNGSVLAVAHCVGTLADFLSPSEIEAYKAKVSILCAGRNRPEDTASEWGRGLGYGMRPSDKYDKVTLALDAVANERAETTMKRARLYGGEEGRALLPSFPSCASETATPDADAGSTGRKERELAQLPDSEIIKRACRSKKTGPTFCALFYGKSEDGDDLGEEEIAPTPGNIRKLLNLVAFYAGPGVARIDAIMRKSALLRSKEALDEWAVSGREEIEKAVARQTSFYLQYLVEKQVEEDKAKERRRELLERQEAEKEREPEIIIASGFIGEAARQTIERVATKQVPRDDPSYIDGGSNPLIYEGIGRRLVRLRSTKNEEGETTKVLAVEELDRNRLQSELNDAGLNLVSINKRGETSPIDAPPRLADKILSSRNWKGVPFLRGVLTTPLLRMPSGDVCTTPGYDAETKFFSTWVDGFAPMDTTAARDLLLSAIEEFPFVGEVDKAVAFASLLTAAVRPQLDTAPALAVTASTPGTGKSALCGLMSIMSVGERMPTVDFSEDEESFKKALTAILREHSPVVVVDNVKPFASVNNSFLCSILTEQQVTSRTLGVSEMGTYSTKALWCINGNKLNAPQDMVRRLLYCRLQRNEENPFNHKFERPDLMGWAKAHRAELVRAAFSLLSAYIKNGMPKRNPAWTPLVGYKNWSILIEGCCEMCGLPNPRISQEFLKENDTEQSELQRFLGLWEDAFGYSRWVTASELTNYAKTTNQPLFVTDNTTPEQRAIGVFLNEKYPRGANSNSVSRFLSSITGKVDKGRKLQESKRRNGAHVFILQTVLDPK